MSESHATDDVNMPCLSVFIGCGLSSHFWSSFGRLASWFRAEVVGQVLVPLCGGGLGGCSGSPSQPESLTGVVSLLDYCFILSGSDAPVPAHSSGTWVRSGYLISHSSSPVVRSVYIFALSGCPSMLHPPPSSRSVAPRLPLSSCCGGVSLACCRHSCGWWLQCLHPRSPYLIVASPPAIVMFNSSLVMDLVFLGHLRMNPMVAHLRVVGGFDLGRVVVCRYLVVG